MGSARNRCLLALACLLPLASAERQRGLLRAKIAALPPPVESAVAELRPERHGVLEANDTLPATAVLQMRQRAAAAVTVPPSFWMWNSTPPAALPPQPAPSLVWAQQTPAAFLTTAPSFDACAGCHCIFLNAPAMKTGGRGLSAGWACGGAKRAPALSWNAWPAGQSRPFQSSQPLQSHGLPCTKAQSYAVVVEDLDAPNGVGNAGNEVATLFWAANIPGDWTSFDETAMEFLHRGTNVVAAGRFGVNRARGMRDVCVARGLHRLRVELWALRSVATRPDGTEVDDDVAFPDLRAVLENLELARAAFILEASA